MRRERAYLGARLLEKDPCETEMSGDQNHKKRFNEAAEQFSLDAIDDMIERYIKEKCGIFDSGMFNVPENMSAVIANAQREIRATLNKTTRDLQAEEDARRLQQQTLQKKTREK